MSKKKLTKKQKQQRRVQEALKAHERSNIKYVSENVETGSVETKKESGTDNPVIKNTDSTGVHQLPIDQIKKDLVKIVLFAVISVGFLVFLSSSNMDFTKLQGIF